MTTEESNKLIAEFMGATLYKNWTSPIYTELSDTYEFKTHPTEFSSRYWQPSQLQYHKDWNWLMPVVEKIGSLYRESFPPTTMFLELIKNKIRFIDEHYMSVVALPISTPMDEVYTAVVQFIQWYNENKP